ncbi:hypothetical protein B9Z65_1476 [Elsinoe australis]|uniref:Uncharacterized protein n=1 Tax=Elsinoe australis TaxID=40998 RepID=A0A2P7YFZ9_9PEZI|nr:hypothetical protein B9Z65_1476 [Elsinoe australis]
MALNLLTLGLLAAAGVAEAAPSLSQFPKNAAAGSICSAAPYKQWLPLSQLPAAQQFCNKKFPIKGCTATVTSVETKTAGATTQTETATINQASEVTQTVASATTYGTTTVGPAPVIKTISATTTETQVICYNQTSAPGGFGTTGAPTTTPAAATTTPAAGAQKRFAGPLADSSDDANLDASLAKRALSPKAKKSLSSRLNAAAALATGKAKAKATAKTICDCIRANPSCSTAVQKTQTTVKSTAYATVTVTATPVNTRNVTVSGTLTVFKTVTSGNAVTINSFVNSTVTSYITGCGAQGGASTTADLSTSMATTTTSA